MRKDKEEERWGGRGERGKKGDMKSCEEAFFLPFQLDIGIQKEQEPRTSRISTAQPFLPMWHKQNTLALKGKNTQEGG